MWVNCEGQVFFFFKYIIKTGFINKEIAECQWNAYNSAYTEIPKSFHSSFKLINPFILLYRLEWHEDISRYSSSPSYKLIGGHKSDDYSASVSVQWVLYDD